MSSAAELWATLADLTASLGTARWKFDVDIENNWWLTCDGRRTHQRQPWRPADETDVLVAATLLFSLNDAGVVPISGRFLEAAEQAGMTVQVLRNRLEREAFHLQLRLRTGRPSMTASGDWRGGWKP